MADRVHCERPQAGANEAGISFLSQLPLRAKILKYKMCQIAAMRSRHVIFLPSPRSRGEQENGSSTITGAHRPDILIEVLEGSTAEVEAIEALMPYHLYLN